MRTFSLARSLGILLRKRLKAMLSVTRSGG